MAEFTFVILTRQLSDLIITGWISHRLRYASEGYKKLQVYDCHEVLNLLLTCASYININNMLVTVSVCKVGPHKLLNKF